jgi:phage/plasmid-associated DNA primase
MDTGVWSRIKLVPFLRIFSDEERDRRLKARFKDEAEHILAWMLEGCLRWQQMGLSDVPVAIAMATAEYHEEMDVMGEWIRERCVSGSDVSAMASVLYASYRDWAEKNGHKTPMTAQAFGRRLSDRGMRRQRIANGSLWKGLHLRM